MLWENDIATLIQSEDRVIILINGPHQLKGLKLDKYEALAVLALYTSYIREKLKEGNEKQCIE